MHRFQNYRVAELLDGDPDAQPEPDVDCDDDITGSYRADSFLWGFCVTLFTVLAAWTFYPHSPNSWVSLWSAGLAGFCVWPWLDAYRRGRDDG
jgi:hypothetical protein